MGNRTGRRRSACGLVSCAQLLAHPSKTSSRTAADQNRPGTREGGPLTPCPPLLAPPPPQVYPFLGRVWCAVCPFMIYGEIVQRWRVASGATLLKWPREVRPPLPARGGGGRGGRAMGRSMFGLHWHCMGPHVRA